MMYFRILTTLVVLSIGMSLGNSSFAQEYLPKQYDYRIVNDDTLRVHVFQPSKSSGQDPSHGIVLLHGGGWVAGSPSWTFPAAKRFADLGMVSMAIEYRLADDVLTPHDSFEDVCSFFGWLSVNADEIGLTGQVAGYGVSAGGHLVASVTTVGCAPNDDIHESVTHFFPKALVLWSPALDVATDNWFVRLVGGRIAATAFSPAENVKRYSVPTIIVIGKRDTLTPLRGAQKYCDQMKALGKTCVIKSYEGLGHLLTRNLSNQESDFDPDPAAVSDGVAQYIRFLTQHGFLPTE